MLNILILGASSQIGQEIALRFSQNNSLTLVGRNQQSLQLVQKCCIEVGAENVELLVQDIADGTELLIKKIGDKQFDLIINLVSATSRVRDSEFSPNQLEQYLMSDLLVPVQLIQRLFEKKGKAQNVIFISSVLSATKSPDRGLYSSLKYLQEMCLKKLPAFSNGGNLLIVKVGKVISNDKFSQDARKLANKTYEAYIQKKKVLNYGWVGRLYLVLYYAQPIVFSWVVKLQRMLRKSKF